MKKFSSLLKELNSKIDLPQPKKSRILLEIAADLNDLYDHYIKCGLSESEAIRQAREKFELSDEIVSDLSEIHSNLFKQWIDKTVGKANDICERILFLLLFIFILLSAIFAVLTTPFFLDTSTFVYPILVLLIFTIVLWCTKFYQLYIKKDHDLKRLRTGMSLFKFMWVASLFIGLYGYFIELYLSGAKTLFLGPLFIITIVRVDEILPSIMDFMIKSSSLMMVCMLVILIIGVLWFNLTQKVSQIEQAETEFLLAE